MISLEIPTLRSASASWRGVSIELADVAANRLAVATVREVSRSPRRRWFADERDALAWAAEQADALTLPLFDLRGGHDE